MNESRIMVKESTEGASKPPRVAHKAAQKARRVRADVKSSDVPNANETHDVAMPHPDPRRQVIVCQRCRKKKIKCDLQVPQCGACARAGQPCVASRLASNDATVSSALGPVETLEAEVASLEERVARLSEGYDPFSTPVESDPSPLAEGYLEPASSIDWSTVGGSGAGTFHRGLAVGLKDMIQYAVAVANDHPYRSSGTAASTNITQMQSILPGHPLLEAYLESYLQNIQTALPFLEEGHIRQEFRKATNQTDAQEQSPVLLLVLALGAILSRDQGSSASFHGMQLFLSATQNFHIVTSETTYETVQLLLLCTLFSMFNPCGGSTWHLVGLAVQTCVTLGLHRQVIERRGESIEVAGFWSVYILDTLVSLALGRPFGIPGDEITTPIPKVQASSQDSYFGFEDLCNLAVAASSDRKGGTRLTSQRLSCLRESLVGNIANNDDRKALDQSPVLAVALAFQLAIFVTGPYGMREHSEKSMAVIEGFNMLAAFLEDNSFDILLSCWTAPYALFHLALLCHLSRAMNPLSVESMPAADRAAIGRRLSRVSMMLKSYCFIFRGLEGLLLLYESITNPGEGRELEARSLQVVENETTRNIIRLAANASKEQ